MSAARSRFGRGATWLLSAAAVAFAAFAALGVLVAHAPPGRLDRAAASDVFGLAPGIAIALTEGGLFPAYAAFGAAGLLLGFTRRALLPAAMVAIASLVVAWQVSDVLKVVFGRPRPPHWLWMHETSASYPSGHAVNVLAFWGVWFGVLAASRPSRWRTLGLCAIALWALGIGWSRLALGAHYASDVVGGYLLGLGIALVASVAAGLHRPRRPPLAGEQPLTATT